MFTCQSATGLHLIRQFLFCRTDIDQIAGKAQTIFLAYVSRRPGLPRREKLSTQSCMIIRTCWREELKREVFT